MNTLCKKLHKFHSVGYNENNISQSFVCIPKRKEKKFFKSPNKTEIVVIETSKLQERGNTGSVFRGPGSDSFIPITKSQPGKRPPRESRALLLQIKV